jgi:hypothetical protein
VSPATSNVLLGCALGIASNIVIALQLVWETAFLEGGRYGPAEANGVEGVIGAGVAIAVLGILQAAPLPDGSLVEDTANTLCCLHATPALRYVTAGLWALFSASTACYMMLSLLAGACAEIDIKMFHPLCTTDCNAGSNFRGFALVARALLVWFAQVKRPDLCRPIINLTTCYCIILLYVAAVGCSRCLRELL